MLKIVLIASLINLLLLLQFLNIILIVGSNYNKTDYEKYYEDMEQCKFLKEYEITNSKDKSKYKRLGVKCKK